MHFIGVDTGSYAASPAYVHAEGGIVCDLRTVLSVPP